MPTIYLIKIPGSNVTTLNVWGEIATSCQKYILMKMNISQSKFKMEMTCPFEKVIFNKFSIDNKAKLWRKLFILYSRAT